MDFRARKNIRNKQETLHNDKELNSPRRHNYTSMYTWVHTDAHTYLLFIVFYKYFILISCQTFEVKCANIDFFSVEHQYQNL